MLYAHAFELDAAALYTNTSRCTYLLIVHIHMDQKIGLMGEILQST
jgi:hypothetical protein